MLFTLLNCPIHRMALTNRAFLVIILSRLIHLGVTATLLCYWPDGTVTDGVLPCLTNGTTSMCCAVGDACTTSGWCLGSSGYIYRGGCTDQSWPSSSCLSICKGSFSHPYLSFFPIVAGGREIINQRCADQSSGSENLYPCSGGYFTRTFCCSGVDTESCCANNFTFQGYFSGQAYLPGQFQSNSVAETSTSSSSQQTVTVTATSQATGSSSGPTSYGTNTESIVGIAVGLPLGVLVVGILTFLIWRERGKMALRNLILSSELTIKGRRSEKSGGLKMRPYFAPPTQQHPYITPPDQHGPDVGHVEAPYQSPEFRTELSATG